jgi:hypothetical protein
MFQTHTKFKLQPIQNQQWIVVFTFASIHIGFFLHHLIFFELINLEFYMHMHIIFRLWGLFNIKFTLFPPFFAESWFSPHIFSQAYAQRETDRSKIAPKFGCKNYSLPNLTKEHNSSKPTLSHGDKKKFRRIPWHVFLRVYCSPRLSSTPLVPSILPH